eukprot:TRINITY_DN5833_c0_g1_i1.p1 TRINITY_DN5833_c0_g1~~TRINITY_DN5833_c0_g1_i1.p1  ORF type:complete len:730 (+),score=268.81 TRINITY_DN5833_c0_g1_i1:211-2400(+)
MISTLSIFRKCTARTENAIQNVKKPKVSYDTLKNDSKRRKSTLRRSFHSASSDLIKSSRTSLIHVEEPKNQWEMIENPVKSFGSDEGKRKYSTHANLGKKTTVKDLEKKAQGHIPITMVTAYDYSSAFNVNSAGIDMILVGDSLGMTMLGHRDTTQVTMEDMIHHCKAVNSAVDSSFVVGDLPFGSYETSSQEAAKNAIRLVKEGKVDAIKLEGGSRVKEAVKAIVATGITVIGHIGLTPQTATALGGFKAQGRTATEAKKLMEDALAIQEAGASFLVLECVPEILASHITKQLSIPTIGIGAGVGCSGQVLVYHDMMGLYPNFTPKFSKQFVNLKDSIQTALNNFKNEVVTRKFPSPNHTFSMKPEEFKNAFGDSTEIPKKINQTEKKIGKGSLPVRHKKKVIAIVGGGAMASLVGGRLASSGDYDVWMISSWKEHIDIINRSGLILQNTDRTTELVSMRATASADEVLEQSGYADLTIVLVKSPQTPLAAQVAAKITNPVGGLVLTLQNGIGNREVLAEAIGSDERVLQGVTSQASYVVHSGLVWHTGHGQTMISSPKNGAISKANVNEVANILSHSGIPTTLTENLDGMVWNKLIVNAGINPLTALLRVKNGELAKNLGVRGVLGETVKEGIEVAHSKGIHLPYGRDAELAVETVLSVARATGENMSSMLVDVMRGSPTEIDAINGAIVREGDKLGISVRTNRILCDLMSFSNLNNAPPAPLSSFM